MLSADDIAQRRFVVALRGFDRDQVTTFLREVGDQVRQLRQQVAELERQPESATRTDDDRRRTIEALGEQTTRILLAAEETAREIEARGAVAARETGEHAERRAREILERANRQAARTLAEAARRRDAAAAEIAALHEDRERFLQGLRTSAAVIGDIVGSQAATVDPAVAAITEPDPDRAPAETEESPESADPAPDAQAETADGPAPGTLRPTSDDHRDQEIDDSQGDDPAGDESVDLDAGRRDGDADPRDEVPPTSTDAVEPEVPSSVEDMPPPAADDPIALGTDVAGPVEVGAPESTVTSRRDDHVGQVRTALARRGKRGLQDVQNLVLAAIREHGRRADLQDLLPREADFDEVTAIGADHLGAAYREGVTDAAAEVRQPEPDGVVEDERVQAAAARFRTVLSHEVTSALRATLRAGLEADEAEPQLSERVGEIFRDLRGPVLEGIVDEHVHRIYGHGLLDAWTQLRIAEIRWEAVDEARCPENRCRTNAAEGRVAPGEEFPSGDRVPPAHPGCNCVVIPAAD